MSVDRNRETSLWNWLKEHLKELRPRRFDVQRIENAIAKGTPDVEGCIDGETFWCELKVAYPLWGERVRVKITQQQVNRAILRCRAGGRSWVLVRVCGETWRENRHFLVPGQHAARLLEPIGLDALYSLSACPPNAAAVELWKTMAELR